jgi:hypothetical protein
MTPTCPLFKPFFTPAFDGLPTTEPFSPLKVDWPLLEYE